MTCAPYPALSCPICAGSVEQVTPQSSDPWQRSFIVRCRACSKPNAPADFHFRASLTPVRRDDGRMATADLGRYRGCSPRDKRKKPT